MAYIDDKEVRENLDKFMKEGLQNLLQQSMVKACIYVEGEAKEKCPTGDGQLRQSITHEVDIDGKQVNGYVGSNVEYAPYVHQGTGIFAINGDGRKEVPWTYRNAKGEFFTTVGLKPSPFLKLAIQAAKDKIPRFFEGII